MTENNNYARLVHDFMHVMDADNGDAWSEISRNPAIEGKWKALNSLMDADGFALEQKDIYGYTVSVLCAAVRDAAFLHGWNCSMAFQRISGNPAEYARYTLDLEKERERRHG